MADQTEEPIEVISKEEMDVLWERASPQGFMRRDDPRLAILKEALGYALDNDGERTPSARLLLERLDEVAISANETARRDAQAAGYATYRHDVTETWAGCATCGDPIRRQVKASSQGLYRGCGCAGAIWRQSLVNKDWVQLSADEKTRFNYTASTLPRRDPH